MKKDKKKIQKAPPGGIELVRNIRKELGVSRYKIAKDLNMFYNSYLRMETTSDDCFTKTMVRLLILAGKSDTEIGKLLRDYAKTENK